MTTKQLAVLSGFFIVLSSPRAANVAWLSLHPADDTPSDAAASVGFTQAPDAGYTALLAGQGHNVTRFVTVDGIFDYPDLVASLNTNDLVIISRSVSSSHYEIAEETAVWNSLEVPVLSLNAYVNRASRLGFHTASTIPDVSSNPVHLQVSAPSHPIFTGIALDTNNMMVNPYAQIVTFTNASTSATIAQRGISVVTSPVVAGGTVLATVGTAGDAAFGGMMIGEFPAGTTSQRGDIMAAKRLVLLTGSREPASGFSAEGAGIYDLLADGATLFINAVNYLTTSQAPQCTVPLTGATNLVEGDAWTFSAGPIGEAPLTFQWYKDNQPLPTGTEASLTLASLTLADAGAYYLIVGNNAGRATSTVARLEFAVFPPSNITNALISYWPLDTVLGTKTPDLVSGYDMTLTSMGAANIVAGKWGKAFQFDNAGQTLLERSHNPGDALPIYQFPDFTVSAWVNGPIQSDHRVFCEASLTNTNPMFDFGTHNGASDGTVDIFIRNDSGAASTDHGHSVAIAFDDTWHNIVYVQREIGNGNMRAQLFVDGVLDSVAITPTRPLTPNTTAIGGIRRASASAWFTGLIDEVAVWNRALSQAEIGLLQLSSITNPPSRLQPLAINQFKADLPAVASGDSTTLRWDVSKDATQVTISPIGDATSQTSFGIGSTSVTLTQAMTYILTITRGADTLTATTRVAVVEGVASGWTLLDNFDQSSSTNLFANGYWNDVSGRSARVTNVNDNPAVQTATAGSIVYLNLRNLAILERQGCTLFFRIIAGADNAAGATNIVGLTDKSQRSYGDEFVNIGPVLYAAGFTNDVIGAMSNAWYLGARNGWLGENSSNPIDFPGPALESNAIYNVWIDITNAPLAESASDTFTVFIQKEGETERAILFQDYISDRDFYYVDAVLGGMLPNLDKLVLLGNSATYSAIFDDFYLSRNGYNAAVPRPYGSTAAHAPGPLAIRWLGAQLEISWTNGRLQQATSVAGPWNDVPGTPASPHLVTPGGGSMFYRSCQ